MQWLDSLFEAVLSVAKCSRLVAEILLPLISTFRAKGLAVLVLMA